MRVAIMQPYLFPYLGYFQLLKAVDLFVIHDDVQYIKNGWVNRNRILSHGSPAWFTLPIRRSPHTTNIVDKRYQLTDRNISRLIRKLRGNYDRAPYIRETCSAVEEWLCYGNECVSEFNRNAIERIASRLGIDTEILVSSQLNKNDKLRGQERVLELCKCLGASTYINPIGGVDLYSSTSFASAGVRLNFLRSEPRQYSQFDHPHVPSLSIIDAFMFNSLETMSVLLGDYVIIEPTAQ